MLEKILLVLLLRSFGVASCSIKYIIPFESNPCPGSSCLTLSQFMNASGSETCNESTTTLFFIEGNHSIELPFTVFNTIAFSMASLNANFDDTVTVSCSKLAKFSFINITSVNITGITFLGCGGIKAVSVEQFIFNGSKFVGVDTHETSLSILESHVVMTDTYFASNLMGSFRMFLEHNIMLNTVDNARVGGAIIVSRSNLTVLYSCFENNQANFGGAIFSEHESNLTIHNSVFTFNRATGCTNRQCAGGALFVDKTCHVQLSNCSFLNNTSDGSGGAIAVFSASLSVAQSFAYNNSAGEAGGIAAIYESNDIRFVSSNLTFNHANRSGGAVYVYKGATNMSSSILTRNKASENGGVIFSSVRSDIVLNNCTVTNNSATRSGGVISSYQNCSVQITNSTLEWNGAGSNGGVVLAELNTYVSVVGSFLINNSATNGGVAYLQINARMYLDEDVISYNKADVGGCLYADMNSTLSIERSTLAFNQASRFGGALELLNSSTAIISCSTFSNNSCRNDGGAIAAYLTCTVKINNSVFYYNTAVDDGAAVSIQNNCMCNISEGTQIHDNEAGDSGGGVYISDRSHGSFVENASFTHNVASVGGAVGMFSSSKLSISSSIFRLNFASDNGGVVHAHVNSAISVLRSSFTNNSVKNDGIIVLSSSNITIGNSDFNSNEAGDDGGAVYAHDNSALTVYGSNFTNCTSGDTGGVVYLQRGTSVVITGCVFRSNKAGSSGGVIHAQQSSNIHIAHSTFGLNRADYGGVVRQLANCTAIIFDSMFEQNMAVVHGGVFAAYKGSALSVINSNFGGNSADDGGVSFAYLNCEISISKSIFLNSVAINVGGVIQALKNNTVNILSSIFENNRASEGGVVYAQVSVVNVQNSSFIHNRARYDGGVIYAFQFATLLVASSAFSSNEAGDDGGVMCLLDESSLAIHNSLFAMNTAIDTGGVMDMKQTTVMVEDSICDSNAVGSSGGVMDVKLHSVVHISNSSFSNNSANGIGGVVSIDSQSTLVAYLSHFTGNSVHLFGGVLYTKNSSTIISHCTLQYNRADFVGGCIDSFMMSVTNITRSSFSYNTAEESGGVLAAQNSVIFINSLATISNSHQRAVKLESSLVMMNNTAAAGFGGGIYLMESSLYCEDNIMISGNTARKMGGGIHAVNSSIVIRSTVHLYTNHATIAGGGISLNSIASADIYIDRESNMSSIFFSSNEAEYGGAMFVSDNQKTSLCSNSPSNKYSIVTECFFRALTRADSNKSVAFYFHNNMASYGQDLYGGLLDRCVINSTVNLTVSAIAEFKMISNVSGLDTISSNPVRLCSCISSEVDCSSQTNHLQIKRGERITIKVAALDHVGNLVAGTVHALLNSSIGSLRVGQAIQQISPNCSTLEYDLFFPIDSGNAKLILFADGPCGEKGISKIVVDTRILPCTCAAGFTQSKDNQSSCTCVCDDDEEFSKYIKKCNASTSSVVREGNFWISYYNQTTTSSTIVSGYIIYPTCPLDYCHPPGASVYIILSLPNGSDSQCAHNRWGLLCGSCQTNFSLSLGSSKCTACLDHWPALLVVIVLAALLSGIVLVILLLFLNLTVAVGSLNSIIFYANIISANKSTFFPKSEVTVASVFISWLNLDIGFDTCFYKGMDTYAKTWLQLAFPIYIIFLVVVIIMISSCSTRFSKLIGKKNPVATLATLVLLSYTKLLQIIIISFAHATLTYPDGSTQTVWLPDASVAYLSGKHIALFCIATVALLFGLAYTVLIFTWQWHLYCANIKIFKRIKNHKVSLFMLTYHNPHTPKHRYWFGLLLLVRVIVYVISALTASVNPRISLVSTLIVIAGLILYKALFIVRVYKNLLLNAMETFVHFNIVIFSIFTWYILDSEGEAVYRQTFLSYILVTMIILMFLLVIVFHVCRYSNAKIAMLCTNTTLYKQISQRILMVFNHKSLVPSDHDFGELFDVIDNPREDSDSGTPYSLLVRGGPTTSIISLTECEEANTPPLHLEMSFMKLAQHGDQQPKEQSKSQSTEDKPPASLTVAVSEDAQKLEQKEKLTHVGPKVISNKSILMPLLDES